MLRSSKPTVSSGKTTRRLVASGVCAAALLLGPASGARAQDVTSPGLVAAAPLAFLSVASAPNADFADLVLPYAPYVFDFVVTVARSFVAVTYDARSYDPVTRDFVVSGLKVGRDGIDFSVDRVRLNASISVYEGIAIDTRKIPMEAEARAQLKKLDAEIIRGDIVSSIRADVPSATYDVDIKADFDNIGALQIAAKVEGFHLLVPLDDYAADFETPPVTDGEMPATPPPPSDAPIILGKLHSASISYDDAGLTPVGFDIAAEAQGLEPNQLRGAIATMMTPMIAGLFQELPGGASPELQERSLGWSNALQAYLAKPEHIEITFSPEEPFDLSQIKQGTTLDEAMILALNPSVSNVATEKTALLDPETSAATGHDDMPLSARLVEGLGVPQDVGRGVALALSDVAAGKAEAADTIVRGIVLDPDSAVTSDSAPSSYVLLLVAQGQGTKVPAAIMTAVRAKLSPEQIAMAENDALDKWRGTEAGSGQAERETTATEARDWGALRDLAFDYYEGVTVPRNITRAFTFASVAAAGGDRVAASLRDNLLAGRRDQRLAFPVDAAREEANAIWKSIVASAAAEEAGATEPSAQ